MISHPTNLYESLFILYKCNRSINRVWKLLADLNLQKEEDRDFEVVLTNFICIEAVSFNDEFDGAFYHKIEPEYRERMLQIRVITKPIFKRIRKWKDLEKFRNNVVAHPWRNKGDLGKFVVPDPQNYNAPRSRFEYQLLIHLNNYIAGLIKFEFAEHIESMFRYIVDLKPEEKPTADYSGLNDDLYKMADEVNMLCQEHGKKYHMKVILYNLPGQNDE